MKASQKLKGLPALLLATCSVVILVLGLLCSILILQVKDLRSESEGHRQSQVVQDQEVQEELSDLRYALEVCVNTADLAAAQTIRGSRPGESLPQAVVACAQAQEVAWK